MQSCKYCGSEVSQERWDAGYHYCMRNYCVKVGLVRPNIVKVSVNKSNDVFELAPVKPISISRTLADDESVEPTRQIRKVARKESFVDNKIFQLRERVLKVLDEIDRAYENRYEDGSTEEYLRRKTRIVTAWNKYVKSNNIRYSSWVLYPGSRLDKS